MSIGGQYSFYTEVSHCQACARLSSPLDLETHRHPSPRRIQCGMISSEAFLTIIVVMLGAHREGWYPWTSPVGREVDLGKCPPQALKFKTTQARVQFHPLPSSLTIHASAMVFIARLRTRS